MDCPLCKDNEVVATDSKDKAGSIRWPSPTPLFAWWWVAFAASVVSCKFCSKCRMVLTYDTYYETIENEKKKDEKITSLEKKVEELQDQQQKQHRQQKQLIKAAGRAAFLAITRKVKGRWRSAFAK